MTDERVPYFAPEASPHHCYVLPKDVPAALRLAAELMESGEADAMRALRQASAKYAQPGLPEGLVDWEVYYGAGMHHDPGHVEPEDITPGWLKVRALDCEAILEGMQLVGIVGGASEDD